MTFNPTVSGISGASDVALNNKANSQVLTYNSTVDKWVNADVPSGGDPTMGGDLSGTASNAQIVAGSVGTAEIANSSVTEPKLAISNTPSAGQVLTHDGTNMTWATSSVGVNDGTRLLDSFAGTTDDDKLTAALTWQQGTAGKPAVRLAGRVHNFNQTRTVYSGLKIIGTEAGPQNHERSGDLVPTKILLGSSVSSGANSWWVVNSGDVYDIYMSNFAVGGNQGSSVHQFMDCFYDGSTNFNNMYACQFHALSFNFMRGVFGRKDRKCAITQVQFTGHWMANNLWDTQFHLGGADCNLWMAGYINIGPSSQAVQTGTYADNDYQMRFDSLTKTNVGYIFMTALNGWRGMWISGNNGHGLRFFGGTYEGMNATYPAPGTVIRIDGGSGAFFSPSIGQAMRSPDAAEKGYIQVSAGEWSFYSPSFYKNGTSESIPFIYTSGGRVLVEGAGRHEHGTTDVWTTRPKYQFVSPVVAGPSDGENTFYCPDMSMVSV